MAALCTARGLCRQYSSLNSRTVAIAGLLVTRTYSRGIRRVPLRILSGDEISAVGKKLTFREGSEFDHVLPNTKKSTGQTGFETTRKIAKLETEDVRVEIGKPPFKGFKISKATKLAETIGKNMLKTNKNESVKENFLKNHDDLKLNIVKDKISSERKLASTMQKVKSSKARRSSGLIFLEGERQIQDAMEAGAVAETIFFSTPNLLKLLPLKQAKKLPELYQVNYNQIQLWSDMVTSPGVIGIFRLPTKEHKFLPSKIPLTLICDNIRDPGNMGTVLRCAASVGCKEVIVLKECVDIWDSKVLRSSCGAHFRIPVKVNVGWEMIRTYLDDDASVILAESSMEGPQFHQELGESLLKAEKEAQSTVMVEVDEENGEVIKLDTSYKSAKLLSIYRQLPLPEISYWDVEFDHQKQVVLVIGGETRGVSNAAYKLAHDFNGIKTHIPLENGMESLNVGTAFGVLAYEIKRKFIQATPSLSVHVNKV